MFEAADHSFVVCAYGESPYLRECIESLLAQSVRTQVLIATATPNELIRSAAEEYNLPLFVNTDEPGIGSDWNFAVSKATTPLVTLAHQDDTYMPTYTERMLHAMNFVARPLIFFTNYGEIRGSEIVDESRLLNIKRFLLRPIEHKGGIATDTITKRRLLQFGSAICCPSVTLARNNLPDPPFNTSMKSNLDWLTWEGYTRLKGAFLYDSTVLMHHRIHEDSTTSALIRDNTRTAEDLAMLERFWPAPIAWLFNLVYSRGQASNS